MSEWSMVRLSKSRVAQATVGSNPTLSVTQKPPEKNKSSQAVFVFGAGEWDAELDENAIKPAHSPQNFVTHGWDARATEDTAAPRSSSGKRRKPIPLHNFCLQRFGSSESEFRP